LDSNGVSLLDTLNAIVRISEIQARIEFRIDPPTAKDALNGIVLDYDQAVVPLEDPICPGCGGKLVILCVDNGESPIFGRAACQACEKVFPACSDAD
jgi:hypothetical protein